HGNRDGGHDLLDLAEVGHARDAAFGADVGGHALEGHDGYGTGVLGDLRLLVVGDVHDDAALEHLGETTFDAKGAAFHRNLLWPDVSMVRGAERVSRCRFRLEFLRLAHG